MNDSIRIEITVRIGLAGASRAVTIEVDREDWEDMDEQERDQFCLEHIMTNIVEWSYKEMPE